MRHKSMDDLGPLQRAVMEAVWELGEATVRQVHERLTQKKSLAYTTVLSTMQKLERVGWLKHRPEGRTYVYSASRTREKAGGKAFRRFVANVFKGDPRAAFQYLVNEYDLSEKDLDSLRAMIEQKRRKESDD